MTSWPTPRLRPYPRRAYPWRGTVARDPLSGLFRDEVYSLANRRGWALARTIGRAGYRLAPGAIVGMYRRIDRAEARGELPF